MRLQELNVLFSKDEQFAMSDTKPYTRTAKKKKKLINKIDIDFFFSSKSSALSRDKRNKHR